MFEGSRLLVVLGFTYLQLRLSQRWVHYEGGEHS